MKRYQLDEDLGGGLRVSSCGLVPENSLRRYLMILRPDSWSDHLGFHLDDWSKLESFCLNKRGPLSFMCPFPCPSDPGRACDTLVVHHQSAWVALPTCDAAQLTEYERTPGELCDNV